MSQDSSNAAEPKKRGRRRTFNSSFYRKAAAYYQEHGWKETVEKFGISGTTMQKVKNHIPQTLGDRKIEEENRTGRSLYLAAKALEKALMRHRAAGSPPSDIEHYAFFLLREILK